MGTLIGLAMGLGVERAMNFMLFNAGSQSGCVLLAHQIEVFDILPV